MKYVCSNIEVYVAIMMGRIRKWHDSPLLQTYKLDWARHKWSYDVDKQNGQPKNLEEDTRHDITKL